MAGSLSPILRLLRQVVVGRRTDELADEHLLHKFSADRDEGCFHALLRRHGPMVLGVCRAVLRNESDAEDAFQATFLILARKAASVRVAASLSSWLHGVAYRTALSVRAEFARRRKHERRAVASEASAPEDLSWGDVQRVLHEELDRLSEAYRAPLILCYLQGETQDDAARLLGLPKGTLKGRLERGRALLRTRLVRRGLVPATALALAAWPWATVPACPTSAAVSATVHRPAEKAPPVAAPDRGKIQPRSLPPEALAAHLGIIHKSFELSYEKAPARVTLSVDVYENGERTHRGEEVESLPETKKHACTVLFSPSKVAGKLDFTVVTPAGTYTDQIDDVFGGPGQTFPGPRMDAQGRIPLALRPTRRPGVVLDVADVTVDNAAKALVLQVTAK
jgi:RNA polymerase sigma factor (sigma-70 family)